jgi:hypothetical protein
LKGKQEKKCIRSPNTDNAEKVMANLKSTSGPFAPVSVLNWENHYSPKYEKCFVSETHMIAGKDNVVQVGMTELRDAFERSVLASSAVSLSGTSGEEVAMELCRIDHERVDCGRARQFIDEHMKN